MSNKLKVLNHKKHQYKNKHVLQLFSLAVFPLFCVSTPLNQEVWDEDKFREFLHFRIRASDVILVRGEARGAGAAFGKAETKILEVRSSFDIGANYNEILNSAAIFLICAI